MVRTQVQLSKPQWQALKRLAAERGVSLAEMVRQGVDAVLNECGESEEREVRQRARLAAGALHGGPGDLARRHDDYLAEAYSE
jgi:hypothetical protein